MSKPRLLCALILLLTACYPTAFSTPTPLPVAVASPTVPPSPTATPEAPPATPTSLIVSDGNPTSLPTERPSLAAPNSLRLTLPTPLPAAISAWRPALYPVPWAPTPNDHFYFLRPIAADEINWPLADYRYGGKFFLNIVHAGVDIPAPIGTPVLAAGPGKVSWAGYGLFHGRETPDDPYGLAVLIRHDFGFNGQRLYTVYGHLDTVEVRKGQHVETGDAIGTSGQTGKVSGPHLHFEVRLGEGDFFTTRNPELWLAPPQGWGVLAGRLMNTGGGRLLGQRVTVRSLTNGQSWQANSYGGDQVYSDEYYNENLVIGDLPAGRYELSLNYLSKIFTSEIEIQAGLVTYITFQGYYGLTLTSPPLPEDAERLTNPDFSR